MSTNKSQNLEIIFQVARERLGEQITLINALAQKHNFILAFNAIVFAAVIGLTRLTPNLFILLGLGLLLSSMILNLFGLRTRKYRGDPAIKALFDKYLLGKTESLKTQLISNWDDQVNFNKRELHGVRTYLLWSIGYSAIGLLLLLAGTMNAL